MRVTKAAVRHQPTTGEDSDVKVVGMRLFGCTSEEAVVVVALCAGHKVGVRQAMPLYCPRRDGGRVFRRL